MKDVSDRIIGCAGDLEDHTLTVLPSLDHVCLEEKPMKSTSHCEDRDINRTFPEFSNTWGDFEGFSEFSPQSEQFSYADETLQLNDFSTSDGEHCTEQTDVHDGWDAFNKDENCEEIFKVIFPSPSVEESGEDVTSLDGLLASTIGENVVSPLVRSDLWSGNAGDLLPGNPRCVWQNSKGCRDLMSLLGVSAENTGVNKDENADLLTDFDLEQSNKSLIQTKLDVTPGSNQGHIFSYQLYLKKPSAEVPLSFLTFSGKKNFFTTNQIRFNF